jgi:hypothetical protein
MASDLAKVIGGTPSVTDAQRIELGLSVRAAPAPIARPVVDVVGVSGRVVSVRVRDGTASGRPRKPVGVAGANVYSFVGTDYPADPAGWRFEGSTTRTRLDVRFPDSVPGGTPVWICATWYNPRARTGPVSLPATTFIQHGMAMAA